jgi:ubiquinone biosynthesis UbiH/UbiF/VisC/COQ6 family hydroxylase
MAYDLTIVGAGLVGATTALRLANGGIKVRLMDAQPQLLPSDIPDLRVVALNAHSIRWLKQINIWSALDQSRLGIFTSLAIEDNGRSLCFDAASEGLDKLGVIAENNHIVAAAHAACLSHPNIETLFSTHFINNESDNQLIISAEGSRSALRQALNIPCFTHDYEQIALVAYVTLEKPHQNQAWQIFLPSGPLAFLPLHDSHQASIVWTVPKHHSKNISNEDLISASQSHYGSIQIISEIASFPLRLQLADQYFKNQVVFIGDALHSIHPLAGQGVNLGFADAQALSEILLAHKPAYWTNPIVLKRYQRQRKSANLLMSHGLSAINLFFSQENPWLVSARSCAVNCLDRLPFLKRYLISIVE